LIRLIEEDQDIFKVTRRLPDSSVSETKVFLDYIEAKEQFDEWLR
jgi:hypothetical protein